MNLHELLEFEKSAAQPISIAAHAPEHIRSLSGINLNEIDPNRFDNYFKDKLFEEKKKRNKQSLISPGLLIAGMLVKNPTLKKALFTAGGVGLSLEASERFLSGVMKTDLVQ